MLEPPTDKRDGRGVVVVDDVLPNRRCGIRDGVASSVQQQNPKVNHCPTSQLRISLSPVQLPVLSNDIFEP